MTKPRLLTMDPWTASFPGGKSNAGITVRWEMPARIVEGGRVEHPVFEQVLYEHEMRGATAVLFRYAVAMVEGLKREIEAGRAGEFTPKRAAGQETRPAAGAGDEGGEDADAKG